jgi:hypothetical protein
LIDALAQHDDLGAVVEARAGNPAEGLERVDPVLMSELCGA